MPNRFDTFEPADEDLGPFAPPVRKKPAGAGISTEKPTSPWEHFLLAMAMGPRPYAQTLLQTKLAEKAMRRKAELYPRETPEEKQARDLETFRKKEEMRREREKTSKQKFDQEYWALAGKSDKTPEEQARYEALKSEREKPTFQLLAPEDLNRLR